MQSRFRLHVCRLRRYRQPKLRLQLFIYKFNHFLCVTLNGKIIYRCFLRMLLGAGSVARRTGRVAINFTAFYGLHILFWPIYVFNPVRFLTLHGKIIGDWVIFQMLSRGGVAKSTDRISINFIAYNTNIWKISLPKGSSRSPFWPRYVFNPSPIGAPHGHVLAGCVILRMFLRRWPDLLKALAP